MIIVYVTCKNKKEAEKIGLAMVKKRLAACAAVIPGAVSFYWWPPRKNKPPHLLDRCGGKIEKANEAILLLKTVKQKFPRVEREVKKLHSYSVPCILALPVKGVSKEYLAWLRKEV